MRRDKPNDFHCDVYAVYSPEFQRRQIENFSRVIEWVNRLKRLSGGLSALSGAQNALSGGHSATTGPPSQLYNWMLPNWTLVQSATREAPTGAAHAPLKESPQQSSASRRPRVHMLAYSSEPSRLSLSRLSLSEPFSPEPFLSEPV